MRVTVAYRLARLNRAVKDYDKDLYVLQTGGGTYQVWRRAYPIDIPGVTHTKRGKNERFILACTKDLLQTGEPVDMGIERILHHLRSQDLWRYDGVYADMCKERERVEESKERERTNKFEDIAADIRKPLISALNL